MPEKINTQAVFSLAEVMQSIRKTLEARYTSVFWVKAEMNKLNYYSQSGHCFPELVEKQGQSVLAQVRATLWKADYERINRDFLRVLKEPLKDGIHIMFQARVQFDAVYGLTLRILEIDPSYSLGELEREKLEAIAALKKENVFLQNKGLSLPLLPQRIAIISVETSKGLADFLKVIDRNPWAYRYFYMLFPAVLQGERAVPSIMGQLNVIRKVSHHFDLVAIIRGGGGDVGLSCYNQLDLARAVATFPLPVFSGIGHSTNETVVEMVAHTNAITPTELADFLIQKFHNFSVPLNEAAKSLVINVPAVLESEGLNLHTLATRFRISALTMVSRSSTSLKYKGELLRKASKNSLMSNQSNLKNLQFEARSISRFALNKASNELADKFSLLKSSCHAQFLHQGRQLELSQKSVELMDPVRVLKRGYSITYSKGKVLTSSKFLKEGEIIETQLSDGSFGSIVKNK